MDTGRLALRRAVEALLEGTSITFRREALLKALDADGDGATAPPPARPDRPLTAREVAAQLGGTPRKRM